MTEWLSPFHRKYDRFRGGSDKVKQNNIPGKTLMKRDSESSNCFPQNSDVLENAIKYT